MAPLHSVSSSEKDKLSSLRIWIEYEVIAAPFSAGATQVTVTLSVESDHVVLGAAGLVGLDAAKM